MQVFKVEQWMTKEVIKITKESLVVEVAELMRKHNIGCLVVVENETPVGIISERDIIRKVVAKKKDPEHTLVEDIMSMNIISVEFGTYIKDVSEQMVKYNIKKMPVVEHGKMRGIITSTDIVRIMADFNKLYDAKDIIELGL